MNQDFALAKGNIDIEKIKMKLEPQDDLPGSAIEVLSAFNKVEILEEGSEIITVPIRDRLESEDERKIIASLKIDQQQLFAVSLEDSPTPNECNICNYVYENNQDISGHKINHEMNLHFCRLGCGIWLNSLEQILEHEYRQHSQPGNVFCCRVCDFLARDADCLSNHMQRHIYVYRFVCAICRRHFDSKQSLQLHRKHGEYACGRVEYVQSLTEKPELVAVSAPVSVESFCDVQIKEEPRNAEDEEHMLLEDNPPISVKVEPQDEEIPDINIKEELTEQFEDNSLNNSLWSTIPIPLRKKLRLPALNSTKSYSDLKSNHTLTGDNIMIPQITQQILEGQKKPIASNILKVLPSNCVVIKLPPNTKILKLPPSTAKESVTISLSDMPKSTSIVKIPQSISITKVSSLNNNSATIPSSPTIQTVLPPQTHGRASCFLVDAFNKSESRPESMKIITEFRNQIRSIEKTLPLPGTVLQASKLKKDIPLIAPKDSPKPVELILNPLSFMVAQQLQVQYPDYRFMWKCPLCKQSLEKHCAFRRHLTSQHELNEEQLCKVKVLLMPYKILLQDSTIVETDKAHVALETVVKKESQLEESTPDVDKTVNVPFLLNCTEAVAALTEQTSALSNICVKNGVSTLKKTLEKTSSKNSRKNNSKSSQFQCADCSKIFTTFGALRIHKSIHTGELPHKCNYCDKRFRTPGQVRVHHRRHTGEKPFKCKICSLDFTHRETLISHLSRHIGMKRYKCYGCDKYFVVVSGLRAHRRLRPDTCGKVKFTARAHGPRVRVIRGEVVFEHHPEHNGYLRSEDPLNILSQRDLTDLNPSKIVEDIK